MIPTMPTINPNGIERNINQGAAAAAQLPSFAFGPQVNEPSRPMNMGEKPIRRPIHPTQQPAFAVGSIEVGGTCDS